MPLSNALLSVRDLTVFRGDEPLFEDVQFELESGQILQIEGSNGSGKTTLLRVLCGLAHADEGEVLYQGLPIEKNRAAFLTECIYLGHKPAIKTELTPQENLVSQQRISVMRESLSEIAQLQSQVLSALSEVNLSQQAQLPCAVLSAGQQHRVALARLFLSSARLWILDEPLTALDLDGREIVQRVLTNHVSAGGSLIYTTHQSLPFTGLATRSIRLDA